MKEKTKKPRYNLGQNMLWMLRQAHAMHRDDVPVFAVIKALAMAGTGISGLLLAPEIVRCVEDGAGFSRILATDRRARRGAARVFGGQRLSGARADVRAGGCAPCARPQDPL